MRTQIRLGVLAAAVLLAPSAPSAATPPPAVSPCAQLAVSPDFDEDRTAFCGGEVRDATTGVVTDVALFVTTDAGHSWRHATATGLHLGAGIVALDNVFVSPLYKADKTLYVQVSQSLFVSTDLGETFTPFAAASSGVLTPYIGLGSVPHTVRTFVLDADRVPEQVMTSEVRPEADTVMSIDSRTGVRTPLAGTPHLDSTYLISPNFPNDRVAYALSWNVGTAQSVLYTCTEALSCPTVRWTFPRLWHVDRIWVAPDFPSHQVFYVSLASNTGEPMQLWRSVDGGAHFARWTAAERLQADYSRVSFDIAGAPGTRDVYLRISGAGAAPYERLFRTRDDGRTLHLVSFGRTPYQAGPRGSMPTARPRGRPNLARHSILAATRNRLFMLGETLEAGVMYESLYCSADGGRSWHRTC